MLYSYHSMPLKSPKNPHAEAHVADTRAAGAAVARALSVGGRLRRRRARARAWRLRAVLYAPPRGMDPDFRVERIAALPEHLWRRRALRRSFRPSRASGGTARPHERLRSALTWTTVHDRRAIITTSKCRIGVFVPCTSHDDGGERSGTATGSVA